MTSEEESNLAAAAAAELNLLFGGWAANASAWLAVNDWVLPALEQHFSFDSRGARFFFGFRAKRGTLLMLKTPQSCCGQLSQRAAASDCERKRGRAAADAQVAGAGAPEPRDGAGPERAAAGGAARGQAPQLCPPCHRGGQRRAVRRAREEPGHCRARRRHALLSAGRGRRGAADERVRAAGNGAAGRALRLWFAFC